MNDEVIIRLTPSPFRRWVGLGMVAGLGMLLLYLGFYPAPMGLGWRLMLVLFGATALYGADQMRRSTMLSVELTERGLSDTAGRVLADLDDIASVDRSAFAFKPSNGFLVRLKKPGTRTWAPGLWWRLGKSVGVGGVTAAADAKIMAELLTGLMRDRDENSA